MFVLSCHSIKNIVGEIIRIRAFMIEYALFEF